MLKMFRRLHLISSIKQLPLTLWRSGIIGSIPKVNSLPAINPTNFNSYGVRPSFIKAHNGALYMLGYYVSSPNIYKGIFKSTDNGLTWVIKNPNIQIPATYNISDFIITNSGRLILQTFTSIATYYSDDEGVTWTSVSANTISLLSIGRLASHANTVILSGNNNTATQQRISISQDNGNTWIAKQLATSGNIGSSLPIYGNGKWVSYQQAGGLSLYTSLDDGNTWTKQTTTGLTSGKEIYFLNGKFFAIASNSLTILWSNDAITWYSITAPAGIAGIDNIDYDPISDSYVFVGSPTTKASQYIGLLSSNMSTITQYGYPSEIQADTNKQNLPIVICNGGSIITLTDPASKCFVSP